MHFLPDIYVQCDACKGRRYNRETLEIRYKGKTIDEVLDLTIEDALAFFAPVQVIHRKLQTLMDVGLSYVRLGQSATTLSGGEAQRVKLSRELAKRDTGRTLYILDEPTTGLHFHDVKQLLDVLHRLRDHGNTVVVIEHNLDVIKTADWIIDLGPEGGDKGGRGHRRRHPGADRRRSPLPHRAVPQAAAGAGLVGARSRSKYTVRVIPYGPEGSHERPHSRLGRPGSPASARRAGHLTLGASCPGDPA